MLHDRIVRLFEAHFDTDPTAIVELAGDGSQRSYFRLVGPDLETAVGAIGPDHEENRAFLSFSRSFREAGLPVPRIFGTDEEAGVWLEEDLGDTTLFEYLVDARSREGKPFPESVEAVYRRVLELLPRFQVEGSKVIDFDVAYPRHAFDRRSIQWDLNYFKYHFLKLAHIPFNEERLERDFRTLTRYLLKPDRDYFLYRDFQSRNIMIRDGEPWFLDYQGGRRGALHYDPASLLYDAKSNIPEEVRGRLLEHYLDVLSGHVDLDRETFREHYRAYVLVRMMQAMGAYGYRGFFERKPRFLQSIPFAARNLARILTRGLPLDVPELEGIFGRIADTWGGSGGDEDEGEGLVVQLSSFSYKGGYPTDRGGHGGGFIFDCRAIPNPGRHLEYSDLSGLDDEVVEYLEEWPEAEGFWKNVRQIVDAQVQEYLRRGFTSLSVAFGCTGGQHRSVYFAERLARHLDATYSDVTVRLRHREARRWGGDGQVGGASSGPDRSTSASGAS